MRFWHSHHATERYVEMGISPGTAEDIVRFANVTYNSGQRKNQFRPCFTAFSDRHPKYAVVFQREDDFVRIVTVTFRTQDEYKRAGATFVEVKK